MCTQVTARGRLARHTFHKFHCWLEAAGKAETQETAGVHILHVEVSLFQRPVADQAADRIEEYQAAFKMELLRLVEEHGRPGRTTD